MTYWQNGESSARSASFPQHERRHAAWLRSEPSASPPPWTTDSSWQPIRPESRTTASLPPRISAWSRLQRRRSLRGPTDPGSPSGIRSRISRVPSGNDPTAGNGSDGRTINSNAWHEVRQHLRHHLVCTFSPVRSPVISHRFSTSRNLRSDRR